MPSPQLGAVEPAGTSFAGHLEFAQFVEEATVANGIPRVPGDLWIDGTLKPDHLQLAWAERLADIPQFVRQVQAQTGAAIASIQGVASVAGQGQAPLLGDWIRNGTFDRLRFAAALARELGGTWDVLIDPMDPTNPACGYRVEFRRQAGT